MSVKVQSGYGLLYLSQILEPNGLSDIPQKTTDKIIKSLNDWGFNLSLPIVCLTQEEERYRLLTGLPIYKAAKEAGLKQIWVLLIAQEASTAEEVIEQVQLQSKLNEKLIEPEDLDEFLEFLNAKESDLTSIPGIKEGYAKLIQEKRPFDSIDEMKQKLGPKRSMNWFKAYQKKK